MYLLHISLFITRRDGAFTFGSIQLAQAQDAPAAEQTEQQAAPAAEATTAAAPAAEEGGIHKEIKVKFIEGTASFMSLVAIALVIGLAFCIERIIYLSLAEIKATIKPKIVVIKATFIPPATTVGEISPTCWILSNACTIPITVPKNPSDGAIAINSVIQEHPFSR